MIDKADMGTGASKGRGRIGDGVSQRRVKRARYRVRNWHEYNESLVRRGMLDVYMEESVIENWFAAPSGRPGAQGIYSDATIQLILQFGVVFGQRLRQTEGLVKSIFNLMKVKLPIPDFSTLSRRAGCIRVELPVDQKDGLVKSS